MSMCRLLEIFYEYLRDRFRLLNLFDSRSTDRTIVYREIVSTRLFLVLLFVSIAILTMFTSLRLQFSTNVLEFPTQKTYEKVLEKNSDSLQCPCTNIAIPYGQFVRLQPNFHQVCSSRLISQEWIDFIFAANLTVIWPMDIRTSLSAMWQLLSALCQSSTRIMTDTLDEFKNSPFISSMLLPEKLLKTKVQIALTALEGTAANNFMRPLIIANRLTEVNGLMSGLAMNYVPFMPSTYGGPNVKGRGTQYIRQGETTVCRCNQAGSCPIPGNIYLYDMWETNSTYDLNVVVANETLPGIIVDCLPIQMTLASSLECFYNETCFNTLLSTYPRTTNITILNKTVPSRFSLTESIENLTRRLFLENIFNETIYQVYYDECSPIHCIYTYAHRFDWIYVLTTVVALFGGLNMTFRLSAPSLVAFVFFLKDIRHRPRRPKIPQNRSVSKHITAKKLLLRLKSLIIELNLIDKKSRNPFIIHRARITTRLYVLSLAIAVALLIFYTSLAEQIIRERVDFPSQATYERLEQRYSNTIQCPCTTISVPYQDFIKLTPIYHQLCASDFVKSLWFNNLFSVEIYYLQDQSLFIYTVSSYFRTLSTFCDVAKLNIEAAIHRFNMTDFVNDKILTKSLFQSQADSLISSFLEVTRIEFSYTISLVNTMIHTNQYVSGTMSNTVLEIGFFYQFHEYSSDYLRVIPHTATKIQNDNTTCLCYHYLDCVLEGKGDQSFEIIDSEGLVNGCFTVQTALKSTLQCWYDMNCTERFRNALVRMGAEVPPIVNALNVTLSSRFSFNDRLELIFNEMMVEKWNSFSSYDNYYSACQPAHCTFTFTENSSRIYILTTIIGLFGGLSVAFRLLTIFLVKIFLRPVIIAHSDTSVSAQVQKHNTAGMDRIRHRFRMVGTRLRRAFVTCNLFDDESTQIATINKQRWSTRLYVILLTISIIIIIFFTTLLTSTGRKTILIPTERQFKDLVQSNVDQLQCPCAHISIPHKHFIKVNTSFHQACANNTIDPTFLDHAFQLGAHYYFNRADLRMRDAAYFGLLSSLCSLSETTVKNAIEQFLASSYIISQMMNDYEFQTQINTTTFSFKKQTLVGFARIFQLLRDINHGNALISGFFLNWYIQARVATGFEIFPTYPVMTDDGCSCGTRMDCLEAGGIYDSYSNVLFFAVPGWNVGCSTIETLLRSTLECFYNQTCIDLLTYFGTIVAPTSVPSAFLNRTLNSSVTSRFFTNTSVQSILDELFIEEWNVDVSYSAFYEQCSPIFCSYRYELRRNFLYILSRILGLYGGITVTLRLAVPSLVELVVYIKIRYFINIVVPFA